MLRHLTSRLCNDLITGTVTSPTSGTFVCAETDWVKANDYFNKYIEVFCYAGHDDTVGTSGNPTNWDGTGGGTYTLTFLPATTLTASDSVEMHHTYTVDEFNDYINLAIDMVAKETLLHKIDETITLKTNVYKYDFSTQFLWIQDIRMEDVGRGVSELDGDISAGATSLDVTAGEGALFPSTGTFPIKINSEYISCTSRSTDTLTVVGAQRGSTAAAHSSGAIVTLLGSYPNDAPIDPRYWRVVQKSTMVVEFVKNLWSPTNDRNIRLTGLASPSQLDTDTEESPLNPAYITYQAAALLHQSRIRGDDVDSEFHRAQMTLCQAMADKTRGTMGVSVGGAKAVIEA